jgi:Amt family ammonium transporter
MATEWVRFGKPSMVGMVTGTIAGLATITPASGFVGPAGALAIGVLAGLVCFGAVQVIKPIFKLDDTLDVFAVHGMGGIVGTVLTGVLASSSLGGVGFPDGMGMAQSLWAQIVGVIATGTWAVVVSFVILKAVDMTTGLRVSEEEEFEGLDITTHGERGYEI